MVASIIDTTAGHPTRVYSFSGLPRNNYGFSLDEIDGSGNVVNNLALFDVVPGQVDSVDHNGSRRARHSRRRTIGRMAAGASRCRDCRP